MLTFTLLVVPCRHGEQDQAQGVSLRCWLVMLFRDLTRLLFLPAPRAYTNWPLAADVEPPVAAMAAYEDVFRSRLSMHISAI